uniref:uncharacterized protein LOC122583666 n=1 Tax=Erigeron canadensis TaxID=72917 RepID=UPI001CB9A25A|nr:uncharacterized protein LOC122583666 [Erigeron canadensis]
MLRVQENQQRLRELGVKSISTSLTSLADSKKTNKRKEIPKITKERDAEYFLDIGGDSDEDNHEEFVVNNKVSKKQHQTQFIAPMSMTRYANLAKQKRVVAPYMSHMPPFEEACNQNGQFAGSDVTTVSYAPLTYSSWHKVPRKDKEKMWQFVLKKYIVPNSARDWVLMTIGASWRGHKSRVKKKHFYKYKDNKTRWQNRPDGIPAKDFSDLLKLWISKKEMNRCQQAKDRRALQKNMHTAGPKSFARIREEMKSENPNKESPKQTQVFERTRKRTEGREYVDTYDDMEMKIELMKNYKPPEEEESVPQDPFLAVMNKEYDGHLRLYGKGVTKKLINKVSGGKGSYMVPREIIESLKVGEVGVVDVEEQERKKAELAEDHERKKAELEAIRKDIDNQRDKLVEDAVRKIMQKLPPGVTRDLFT